MRKVEKLLKMESKKIPKDLDYDKVINLASEAKQKLKKIMPETLAYLKKEYSKNE